ncbi:hypothetical protein GOBAR_AA26148 [Gossypium barbadense]|uniref:Uncharacterized protein n=1 Tax=Gossypium barbadense TaxID=3634 RepID=A0A2P5WTU1_GOSBA|nr:hypothetical protein GOBAR_AA26148 [Gossypium barbadense]
MSFSMGFLRPGGTRDRVLLRVEMICRVMQRRQREINIKSQVDSFHAALDWVARCWRRVEAETLRVRELTVVVPGGADVVCGPTVTWSEMPVVASFFGERRRNPGFYASLSPHRSRNLPMDVVGGVTYAPVPEIVRKRKIHMILANRTRGPS